MLNRVLLVFISIAFAAVVFGGGPTACGAEPDIHKTEQALANDCVTCHQSAYVAALTPKHEGTFSKTCDNCHNSELWSPLDEAAGATIHEEEVVKDGTLKCFGCHNHKTDYEKTTKPKHEGLYPTDCKDCHGTEKFAPLAKDIHSTTTFGSKKCIDCHKTNYDGTTAPKHTPAAQAPDSCPSCHFTGSTTCKAWSPSRLTPGAVCGGG